MKPWNAKLPIQSNNPTPNQNLTKGKYAYAVLLRPVLQVTTYVTADDRELALEEAHKWLHRAIEAIPVPEGTMVRVASDQYDWFVNDAPNEGERILGKPTKQVPYDNPIIRLDEEDGDGDDDG